MAILHALEPFVFWRWRFKLGIAAKDTDAFIALDTGRVITTLSNPTLTVVTGHMENNRVQRGAEEVRKVDKVRSTGDCGIGVVNAHVLWRIGVAKSALGLGNASFLLGFAWPMLMVVAH